MSRPQQRLLAQLATSPNEIASGLGQCLEALRLISALPRASPVYVHYTSAVSPTIKAFGREHLTRVPLRTVIGLIKTSFALTDPVRVTTAVFYREDGTIDPTPVLVDEDSWRELAPYVHTLHVEDDLEPLSASRSTVLSSLSASTVVVNGNGNGNGPAGSGVASSGGVGKVAGSALNSNASTFVPSSNGITVKTGEGARVPLGQGLRKLTLSPSSPRVTSPFSFPG